MGGTNSGRWGGRPTVESGLSLDVRKLVREGCILPGGQTSGQYGWSNPRTGKQTATIDFAAEAGDSCGSMRLIYRSRVSATGEVRQSDYQISLVTTEQQFGGRRWWFVCPHSGARVAKLHLPPGQFVFASREAHRLGYRSQRESPHDRALRRAFKLRGALGADGGIGDVILKPKGMHQTTFDQWVSRVRKAERICDRHLILRWPHLVR